MNTPRTPLSALMPATRIGLLTAVLTQPDRWWYLSELARRQETTASSLQRELAALTEAEILLRRQDGNRVYYRANPDCPLLPELHGLIAKTTGLVGVLREALRPVEKRIRVACVYGSMARGEQDASSDVDLLVVGRVGLKDLVPCISKAADRLARPVNPSVYSQAEFARKVAARNRFLRNVIAGDLLFVIGTPDELGRAASAKARPTARG